MIPSPQFVAVSFPLISTSPEKVVSASTSRYFPFIRTVGVGPPSTLTNARSPSSPAYIIALEKYSSSTFCEKAVKPACVILNCSSEGTQADPFHTCSSFFGIGNSALIILLSSHRSPTSRSAPDGDRKSVV